MPIERYQLSCFSADWLESKRVAAENKVLQSVFDENTLSPSIEPAILDQLEKKQSDRFYNFNQYQILLKLQIAFNAGIKVYKQNLPSKRINY